MSPAETRSATEATWLESIQAMSFEYFRRETNPANGLVLDRTAEGAPSSIAAVGLGLASYPVAVERGFIRRDAAVARVLASLRFLWSAPQGPEPTATGHKGLFYHFLDMRTGARAGACELSTVDSALFFAGALAAAAYFDRDTPDERDLRELADRLYERADWRWALDGGSTIRHGWKPESGFLPWRWEGYDEALILYVLALGSPTNAIPVTSYPVWASTYEWRTIYDWDLLHAGALFIHQMSHVWIDFRGIQDAFMRDHSIDYFENTRRATYVQREYAKRNPLGFARYGERCWGITASDGPGERTVVIDGVERTFHDYLARGVPDGPDDGTLAPWAVIASLPFAPEIVLPTMEYFRELRLHHDHAYGFKASFNPTFRDGPAGERHPAGWVSPVHFGINLGPIIAMIENHRTGLLWQLMRQCPYIVSGLRRAGFTGGWL